MATEQFIDGVRELLYIDTATPITADLDDVVFPGDFELVGCLTSNGFSGTTGTIDTTSKCSGKFTTSLPGDISWSISAEGNSIDLPSPGSGVDVSNNALFKLWKAGTTFWAMLTDVNTLASRYGLAYISSYDDSAPRAAAKTFSITLTGVGEPGDQDDLGTT